MDEAGAVGITDSGAGLHHQGNACFDREAAALTKQGFQVGAGNEFHDNEKLVIVIAKIIYGDNIGVRKIGRRARFVAKLLLEIGVFGIIFAQNLDRHITIKHLITGTKNPGHAAGAKVLQQLIAIEKQVTFADWRH